MFICFFTFLYVWSYALTGVKMGANSISCFYPLHLQPSDLTSFYLLWGAAPPNQTIELLVVFSECIFNNHFTKSCCFTWNRTGFHCQMCHYPGENPRGFWQLKLIDNPLNEIGDRVLNGFGTLHLDTSKQDTDVEDLEEQVIDDQTKQQQTHVQQLKLQVSPRVCSNNVVTGVVKKY